MDILTHAAVGAATGLVYGHPVVGALVAVLPDIVLGVKRKEHPPESYYVLHSLTCIAVVFPILYSLFGMMGFLVETIIMAWTSHIVLDAVTHGNAWCPRLLYPSEMHRGSPFGEWEWFNRSWWFGLSIALIWICVCLLLSFDIGSPSSPSARSMVFRT